MREAPGRGHAVRIDVDGPSYRQHLGQVRAEARTKTN